MASCSYFWLLPDASRSPFEEFARVPQRGIERTYGNRFAADNLNYARSKLLDPRIESEFVTRLVSPPEVQRKLEELRMRIAAVSL